MKNKNVIATITNVKKSLKTSLQIKFTDIICQQMSERTLESLDNKELREFILVLYDYFILEHHKNSNVYLGKPKLESPSLTNKLVLKICQPDAPHLFITIEEILRKHKLRTTRRLHPIISVKRNKSGKIVDILPPSFSHERRSLVFIAFENLTGPSTIKQIKLDIDFHFNAVQHSESDAKKIQQKVNDVASQLSQLPNTSEWLHLLSWLNNQNFSFFGFHSITHKKSSHKITDQLGICKKQVKINDLININSLIIEHANNEAFIVDRTTIMSPIQRFEPLMKISFKFGSKQVIFYGILKRSSMYAKNIDTPLIHKKIDYIIKKRQFLPGSYDYNEVIRIFNDIPKFELFRTPKEELLEIVNFIMSVTNPNHVVCLKKYNKKNNTLKLYFVIPYYFFAIKTIELIKTYICNQLDYAFHEIVPINAPEKCRIHFHFKLNTAPTLPNEEIIERTLTQMIQPWEDQAIQHMQDSYPDILTKETQILDKIPSHYKSRTKPQSAGRDSSILLSLSNEKPIKFELIPFNFPESSELAGKASMLLLYHKKKLDLTNILPILHNLGIHCIDQLTSRFGDQSSTIGYILAFRLVNEKMNKLDVPVIKDRLIDMLEKIYQKKLPNDYLNKLVMTTSLNSSAIFILQGIRSYFKQLFQTSFSSTALNQTLIEHPKFSENLYQLFHAKFDPTISTQQRKSKITIFNNKLSTYLKSVSSISQDQILRRLLSIINSCIRTNVFIKTNDEPTSFKFQCKTILGMETPVPYKETFVFDYHLEGVHIRFGEVARGGLRWSNRNEDYRTEVLGLVKTQQTKNAVIIPVGSKGGFVIKNTEEPITQDIAKIQYKRFISAMLQITDNIINHKRSTSKQLICHDEFDPYFVVAADKGTATFSDLANSISLKRNFWLNDGFASGGEHGYDHKKVGITAKGAWECCKLHFKAINKNPETDPLRVIGVGDMSGDVFGNGMLLSKSIQLIAAFNHKHIFIDPNPNPQTSWKERSRLFNKPQSNWTDYSKLSKGGGIFDRSSKEIQCSAEIVDCLKLKNNIMSGEDLIKAILKAKVDLLWFGGIGTYIKSSEETNFEVGDPANNNVRVNAIDVRASVISEGANLAITQEGRVEFDQNEGRINTDAIDNSAGVNMSDYEVNIKILLSTCKQESLIKTEKARNKILEDATEEVTTLVLQNNIEQHHLISMDRFISIQQSFSIDSTITQLIQDGRLSVSDEKIPNSKERHEYFKQQLPLPRPVLAKCQAYSKMKIKELLLQSTQFNGAIYNQLFTNYFPNKIQTLLSKMKNKNHRLRQQIIITELTNYYIGVFGCSAFETISCYNRIPIDTAIHHMSILEEVFETKKTRQALMANISLESDFDSVVQLNNTLAVCNYIGYLLSIPYSEKKINKYRSMVNDISNKIPMILQPIFFQEKININKSLNRLKQLDKHCYILSNAELLASLKVKNQVNYDQKISILSELISVISKLLSCNDRIFKLALNHTSTKFVAMSESKNVLSRLYLYVFELKKVLGY